MAVRDDVLLPVYRSELSWLASLHRELIVEVTSEFR